MNNTDLNNMRLLKTVLQKVLPDVVFPGDTFSNGKVRAVLADLDYEKDSGWARDAGIAWTRRHLERSKEPEPVLIIGYDREETVRRRAEGSLLENSGIAYIRLPARLEEIRASIKSLQDVKRGELDEKSVLRNKEDVKKDISLLRHNIKNLLQTISMVRFIEDEDLEFVETQWPSVRDSIIASKINRVDKEIKLYNTVKIGKGDDIYDKLTKANRLYKGLFGHFSSGGINGISAIIEDGEALINLLEDVLRKLEVLANE